MSIDFDKINDTPHLLDILIQMEDILDSLDIYVFKNWIKGVVVEGPIVSRHWYTFTLKYPYKDMPDPRAGKRLLKHGIKVSYSRATDEPDDRHVDITGKMVPEESETLKEWMVTIGFPKRLIGQFNYNELEIYDDEIDIDDIEDAKDEGITAETGYVNDENNIVKEPDEDIE